MMFGTMTCHVHCAYMGFGGYILMIKFCPSVSLFLFYLLSMDSLKLHYLANFFVYFVRNLDLVDCGKIGFGFGFQQVNVNIRI